MRNTLSYRRRAAAGLGAMTVGATLLVIGVASPASAHGKQEPVPAPNKSCPELAELFDIDQDWSQFTIDEFPEDDFTKTYTIDDRGTADESDDAAVTVTIEGRKYVAWESTIGIDAVNVNGVDHEQDSAFYIYAASADDEEETNDTRLGTNPWEEPDKNKLESISFCFDEEKTPPSTVPSTTSSSVEDTTSTSVEETTSTSMESTTSTSTTMAPSTVPSSTTPPTTTPPSGGLPRTGSNTGLLVAIGAALLAIGGVLVAGKRQIWRGNA